MFLIIVILEETFAPPIIAVTGRFFETKILLIDSISFFNNSPAHFSIKNFGTVDVEACALWVVPKASLT